MEFKDRIKGLRLEKGITTTFLAAEFGKSDTAIRMWETGRSKPDVDTLIKLAKYFDCTTEYLLGLSELPNEQKREAALMLKKTQSQKLSQLNEVLRSRFYRTIDRILESFWLVNKDTSPDREGFEEYCLFLDEMAALFNAKYGEFPSEMFIYDEKDIENDEFEILFVFALGLKKSLDDIIFHELNMRKEEKVFQRFAFDYKKYRRWMAIQEGDNDASDPQE